MGLKDSTVRWFDAQAADPGLIITTFGPPIQPGVIPEHKGSNKP